MAVNSVSTSLSRLVKTTVLQPCLGARFTRLLIRSYATESEFCSASPNLCKNPSGGSRPSVSRNGQLIGANDLGQEPLPSPRSDAQVEAFSGPSQPRQYYERPKSRDLPRAKKKWPAVLGVAILGVASWAAFLTYATNQEKISSSVFRSIIRAVRRDPNVKVVLGEAIRPQPEWWLNGDPYVRGQIGQLQGNIDVSFRIKGSNGAGTVYFTSIRKDKGVPYTTLRFKVIADNGTVIRVEA